MILIICVDCLLSKKIQFYIEKMFPLKLMFVRRKDLNEKKVWKKDLIQLTYIGVVILTLS